MEIWSVGVLENCPRITTCYSISPCFNSSISSCGAEGDRTLDLSIANAALSHLSYGPKTKLKTKNMKVEYRAAIARVLVSNFRFHSTPLIYQHNFTVGTMIL